MSNLQIGEAHMIELNRTSSLTLKGKRSVLSTRRKKLSVSCPSLFCLKSVRSHGKGRGGRRSALSAIPAAAKPEIPYSWDCDLSSLSLLSCTCNDLLVAECRVAGKMWCSSYSGGWGRWGRVSCLSFTFRRGNTSNESTRGPSFHQK